MSVLENVFDEIESLYTGLNIVYVGYASQDTIPLNGVINIVPVPSIGLDNRTGTSYNLYQVDIWHGDIYQVEDMKESIMLHFAGLSKVVSGMGLMFYVEADNGIIRELEDSIWHGIITVGVRFALRS